MLLCSVTLYTVLDAAEAAPSNSDVNTLIDRLKFQENLDWNDFLITDHLPEIQRDELNKKIQSQIRNKIRKEYHFEVLDKKVLRDVCAFIICATDERNPIFSEISGLTFCKVKDQWKLTPLMGSFRHTGFNLYQLEAEARQRELEKWVFKQQAVYKSKVQGQQENKLLNKISEFSSESAFQAKEPSALVLYFLSMVKQANFHAIAACLGVDLAESFGDDELQAIYSLVEGLSGGRQVGDWAKLQEQPYIATVLEDDDNEMVSVAMFFPELEPKEQILEFSVKKMGSRWVLELPDNMSLDDEGKFSDADFRGWKLKRENRSRLDEVSPLIISSLKPVSADSSGVLLERLLKALSEGDFATWCSCIKFMDEADKAVRRDELIAAAESWSEIKKKSLMAFKLVSVREAENVAVAKVLAVSKQRPNDYVIDYLVLCKANQQWHMVMEKSFEGDDAEGLRAARDKLIKEIKDEGDVDVAPLLLGECHVISLANFADCTGVDQSAVKESYLRYDDSLMKEDYANALKVAAAIKGTELQTLAALGADLRGRQDKDSKYEFIVAHKAAQMCAATIRLTNRRSSDVEYLLYFYCKDGEQVLVLPYLQYRYEQSRGARLFNAKVLEFVEGLKDQGIKDSFMSLINKHNELVNEMRNE
ncbi:hypothetical protein SAMN02745181_1725 [Rubritalea squalenifaciens DSM 18772]|uniref:Uncharacterized protein n=1 Tax=Rubritalea squalenifaciens DSM 18772 TaxID=1123071 RepID=A0A1M6I952_9BACT|nr:hypothetical protein SAMN02745181_1725 [Rubritalea squalenifaciens DSM 18772]